MKKQMIEWIGRRDRSGVGRLLIGAKRRRRARLRGSNSRAEGGFRRSCMLLDNPSVRWLQGLSVSCQRIQNKRIFRTLESVTTLTAFANSALSSKKTVHSPSACPITGILLNRWIFDTSALLPRGITRSMYLSSSRREEISSRDWTVWM